MHFDPDVPEEGDRLAALAERTYGTPQAARPLAEVAREVMLAADVRDFLVGLGNRAQLSVGDFLADGVLHQETAPVVRQRVLVRAFKRWFERHGGLPPAPPVPAAPPHAGLPKSSGPQPGAPRPGTPRAGAPVNRPLVPAAGRAPSPERSLRDLLAATRLPDIEDWPVSVLDPNLWVGGAHVVLGDLASEQGFFFHGAEKRAAITAVQAFLSRLESLRQQGRGAPPLLEVLASTGDDELDRLLRSAAAARQDTLAVWPAGLLAGKVQSSLDGDRLRLTVTLAGSRGQAFVDPPPVPLWGQKTKIHCSCGSSACIHRAVALDMVLRAASEPEGHMRELLRQGLLPRWQRAIDDFLAIEDGPTPKSEQPGALSFSLSASRLELRFHALGKRGKAKTGKRVNGVGEVLRRLAGPDRRIAELMALAEAEGSWDGASPFVGDAVLLLVGHPDVHWQGGDEAFPVERVEARASAEELPTGLRFRIFAGESELKLKDASSIPCTGGRVLPRLVDGRLTLVHVPATLLRFSSALEHHGAEFPRKALPALAGLLQRLEAVAPVDLPEELRGEERPSLNRPAVRVDSAADGLLISLRIEPLAQGPLFMPGQGVELAVALEGHRRVFTRRAFEREIAEASAVAGQLGLDPAAAEQPYSWRLPDGPLGVDTLRRLSAAAGQGLTVEWKVPKPRFSAEARLDKLRLTVSRSRDWFGLDGEVEVDGHKVRLAALLEAARLRRQWVKVGPDDYAQLSEQLVEKLAPLAHLGEGDKPPQLTLGTIPLIDALAPLVEDLQAEEGYRALLDRLGRARTHEATLPQGLTAELRDYQVEGFRWLSRLAEWGAGAVLADDMGLGKTLQALALLLARAGRGPALVVAPASVLHIWRSEAERFAPSLRVHLFHETERTLGALGPGDVVAVSWSLLSREADLFASTRFATVVLDEAHAIKNASTLRARSAHRLQADFVVALSGTPIENHLGELWSLLRAVLPSLLGSEESFRRRFTSTPASARALAQLAQPFILRRTKGEVARELPPRTEVELLVPLSAEERALYDSVRLAAAADLGEITADDQRFQVLAALTRLRLAACHPRLVQAEWEGPTSKLSRLLELSRDLIAGGHKALVFSQFTQHLALVADALRAEGIAFSYLDGQVPLAERQRRVERFQAGEGGELFLISLKAGGTGLTLTAADYVIHLDPWWNPAVEDQASDRAHRIGQERPVTIYRLIAEGSIEQQILSLHREKRDLVDAFLAGADRAGKLSAAQLADLIRSG